ncbi:cardiolipin synthase [Myroides sp. LJL115]
MFIATQYDWFIYVEIIYFLLAIAVSIRIIYDTNSISKTLAYLLLVFFVPILGMIFYFSFGINYRKRKMYSKKLQRHEDFQDRLAAKVKHFNEHTTKEVNQVIENNKAFISLLSSDALGENPLLVNNKVNLLENGESFFEALLQDLKHAKQHIHIEYYIFDNSQVGHQIADILVDKIKQGVEVRFIYDDFGSRSIRKSIAKRLRKAGGHVFPFNKVILLALANRLNYRNHRKIVVIDGYIGYTGGINISDRYDNRMNQKNDFFWRDTHMKITGSGVYGLQYVFLTDWNFCSKESITFNSKYFPSIQDLDLPILPLQVLASGPDSDVPSILYSVIEAISQAKEEVLITTPYYIPDESLQLVIKMAALSGKKVKMILPGITDSLIVKWASESYFQELLENGVEIYLYKKGFIHAKTIVTDQDICCVGTCNLDHRSFDLNFEVNVYAYDPSLAQQMRQMFYRDCQDSLKLDIQRWNKRSSWQRLKNNFIRLLAPLL